MKLAPLLLALSLAPGCSDDDDSAPEGCTFRGQYELGLIPRVAGCLPDSFTIPGSGMEDVCFTTESGLTPTGVAFELAIFCEPASPVIECTGRRSDSNGCLHDVYVRRIAP